MANLLLLVEAAFFPSLDQPAWERKKLFLPWGFLSSGCGNKNLSSSGYIALSGTAPGQEKSYCFVFIGAGQTAGTVLRCSVGVVHLSFLCPMRRRENIEVGIMYGTIGATKDEVSKDGPERGSYTHRRRGPSCALLLVATLVLVVFFGGRPVHDNLSSTDIRFKYEVGGNKDV